MRDYARIWTRYWRGMLAAHIRSDPKTAAQAHAVAFYLSTTEHSNMIGLYRLPESYILEDTGIPLQGARKGLERLIKGGFVVLDRDSQHVWIRHALRLELTPKSGDIADLSPGDNRLRGLKKVCIEFVNFPIYKKFHAHYAPLVGDFLPDPEAPCKGVGKPLPSQEQEQEQEHQQEQPEAAAGSGGNDKPKRKARVQDLSYPGNLVRLIPDFEKRWLESRKTRKLGSKTTLSAEQKQIDKLAEWAEKYGAQTVIDEIDAADRGGWQGICFKEPAGNGGRERPGVIRAGAQSREEIELRDRRARGLA